MNCIVFVVLSVVVLLCLLLVIKGVEGKVKKVKKGVKYGYNGDGVIGGGPHARVPNYNDFIHEKPDRHRNACYDTVRKPTGSTLDMLKKCHVDKIRIDDVPNFN